MHIGLQTWSNKPLMVARDTWTQQTDCSLAIISRCLGMKAGCEAGAITVRLSKEAEDEYARLIISDFKAVQDL